MPWTFSNGISVVKPPRPVRVRNRTILDDARVVVAPGRARHPERREDARAGELGERLTAHARDNDRREVVAGVAVGVARPGGKVERALAADDVEDVGVRVRRESLAASRRWRRRSPNRGVRSCGSACAGWSAARRSRAAPGCTCAPGSSSESFPSRASSRTAAAVNCFDTDPASKIVSGLHRNVVLEVRHPVRLLQHGLVVLADTDRAPRRRRVPFRQNRIDACSGRSAWRAAPPSAAAVAVRSTTTSRDRLVIVHRSVCISQCSRGPTSLTALGAPPPSAATRASRSRLLKAVARSAKLAEALAEARPQALAATTRHIRPTQRLAIFESFAVIAMNFVTLESNRTRTTTSPA